MIPGDFFCNSPRPSCRISGASIVPPYPVGSIVPAAFVETICSASRPVQSPRPHAASRPPFRFSGRWAGRFGVLPCRYSRNGIDAYIPLPLPALLAVRLIALSPRQPATSRLPPRPPCRGAGRRPFPRVCVDNVDCPIYIYDLPAACYSIGVEREQTERIPK